MKKILCCLCAVILIFGSITIVIIFNCSKLNSVNKSVVYIESINEDVIKSGSGFVYKVEDNKNYIVTSYHVIEDYTNVYVYDSNRKKVKASVLNYDEYIDIAVLTIEDNLGLKEISIGNSNFINREDEIYVVGTPLNIENINTVTKGKITVCNKEITINTTHGSSNLNAIEVSAEVDYGNSGGPLLNKNSEVIGVMFIKEESNNKSYALPINFVIEITDKLIDNELKRPNLGAVMCNTTNIELLYTYGINYIDINGVVLLEVKSNYALDNANLKKGDIITYFHNKRINNVNELREELYKKTMGDSIEIEYYRNGNYYKVNIQL